MFTNNPTKNGPIQWGMVGEFSHHKALYFGGVLRRNFQLKQAETTREAWIQAADPRNRKGWWFLATPLKNDGVSESQLG
jgi:hypothetical protein